MSRGGGWVVSCWTGEIDGETAEALELSTLDGLRPSDDGLTIDLSSVTYVDSAGIRVLAALSHRLTERRKGLLLVVPERSVLSRALEVGGISAMIPTFPSLRAAHEHRSGLTSDRPV